MDTMIGNRSESRRHRRQNRRLVIAGIACLAVGVAVLLAPAGGRRQVHAQVAVPSPLDPSAVARAAHGATGEGRTIEVRRDTRAAAQSATRRALRAVGEQAVVDAEHRQADAAQAVRTAVEDLATLRTHSGIVDPALAVRQEELVVQTLSRRSGLDARIAPAQQALFELRSLALQDAALERRVQRTSAAEREADHRLARLRRAAAAAPLALITVDDDGGSPAPPQLVFGVAVLVLGAAALLAAGPARRRGRRSRRPEPAWVPEPRARRGSRAARRQTPAPRREAPRPEPPRPARGPAPTPGAAPPPPPTRPAARPVEDAPVDDAPVPVRRPTPIVPEPAPDEREPMRIRVGNLAAPPRSRGAPFTVRSVRLVPSARQRHGSIRPPE